MSQLVDNGVQAQQINREESVMESVYSQDLISARIQQTSRPIRPETPATPFNESESRIEDEMTDIRQVQTTTKMNNSYKVPTLQLKDLNQHQSPIKKSNTEVREVDEEPSSYRSPSKRELRDEGWNNDQISRILGGQNRRKSEMKLKLQIQGYEDDAIDRMLAGGMQDCSDCGTKHLANQHKKKDQQQSPIKKSNTKKVREDDEEAGSSYRSPSKRELRDEGWNDDQISRILGGKNRRNSEMKLKLQIQGYEDDAIDRMIAGGMQDCSDCGTKHFADQHKKKSGAIKKNKERKIGRDLDGEGQLSNRSDRKKQLESEGWEAEQIDRILGGGQLRRELAKQGWKKDQIERMITGGYTSERKRNADGEIEGDSDKVNHEDVQVKFGREFDGESQLSNRSMRKIELAAEGWKKEQIERIMGGGQLQRELAKEGWNKDQIERMITGGWVSSRKGEGDDFEDQEADLVDPKKVMSQIRRNKQKQAGVSEEDLDKPQGNIPALILYTLLIGLGNIQAGFAIAGNNQVAPVIKAKFGWDKSDATLYNTMISASSIVGVVMGALAGGKFIQYGRRNSLINFNIISAVALIGTQFLSVASICTARLIFGFCCGVLQVAGVKMLEETVPTQNQSAFGTATNTLLAFGIMIAILLAVGLPDGDDLQGMKDDEFYRVIYGFPWLLQAMTIILCFTYYTEDSIVFLIQQGKEDEALKTIKKVYSKDEDPQKVLNVVKMQSSSSKKKSGNTGDTIEKISITEAMTHPKYRNATWVAFLLCFFQQQTGLDGLMIYSNTIFAEMKDRGSISFSAKQGSYIVGCWSLFVAVLSPALVRRFPRRTLLLYGQTSMAISLCLVGIFYMEKQDVLTIIGINWFIMSFQLSQGPIAWMYAGEVASDTGLGLAILALYASLLEKAITMEFMVHSKAFGPEGMFFFLGGITSVGAIFIFFVIKETQGLEDKQKKLLYTPAEWLPEDDILGEIEMQNQAKSQPLQIGKS